MTEKRRNMVGKGEMIESERRKLRHMMYHADSVTDHKGKLLETIGRKAMGAKVFDAKPARLLIDISKPLETMGRKTMGAKALLC